MPRVKYKSTTTGKVDKLVMFECKNCGNTEELFATQEPWCACCELDDGIPPTMEQIIFSPKDNGQRWREND